MRVRVTFEFSPEDPDPADRTGMSEEEYTDLLDRLMELGAEDVRVEQLSSDG